MRYFIAEQNSGISKCESIAVLTNSWELVTRGGEDERSRNPRATAVVAELKY